MILMVLIFTSSYEIHEMMPSILPILRREIGENYYSLSAYYVGMLLIRIPYSLIKSFLSFGIIFFCLNIFRKSFLFYLKIAGTMTLISIAGNAYGFMVSGMFESIKLTIEIATPFDVLFVLVSGMYLNLRSVPFLKYISIFFYGNEALSLLYWTNITYLGMYLIIIYYYMNIVIYIIFYRLTMITDLFFHLVYTLYIYRMSRKL